jgi:hypothetical protein
MAGDLFPNIRASVWPNMYLSHEIGPEQPSNTVHITYDFQDSHFKEIATPLLRDSTTSHYGPRSRSRLVVMYVSDKSL